VLCCGVISQNCRSTLTYHVATPPPSPPPVVDAPAHAGARGRDRPLLRGAGADGERRLPRVTWQRRFGFWLFDLGDLDTLPPDARGGSRLVHSDCPMASPSSPPALCPLSQLPAVFLAFDGHDHSVINNNINPRYQQRRNVYANRRAGMQKNVISFRNSKDNTRMEWRAKKRNEQTRTGGPCTRHSKWQTSCISGMKNRKKRAKSEAS